MSMHMADWLANWLTGSKFSDKLIVQISAKYPKQPSKQCKQPFEILKTTSRKKRNRDKNKSVENRRRMSGIYGYIGEQYVYCIDRMP